ncbi:MAG: phytoene desaturase family protein [Cyclobacteriaceae bacterium]
MTKAAVIGSGFSGLAAACTLAREGFDVTVLEKNSSPGGRARKFETQGFMFDMGPSWYWMPDVFESFFKAFNKKTSDYYSLVRLDPSYRVFYSKEDVWDIPAGVPALCEFFERIEPGSSVNLLRFLEEGQYKYEVGMQKLVYKPGLSITELMDAGLLKGMLKLHVFQSMSAYVRKYFNDQRLIQLLEFPVLFLGAAPKNTPALYSLMNYADMSLGTWYPQGGMYKIIEGMVSLAESLGVKFRFNATVEQIVVHDKMVEGLIVNGKQENYTYVVAGADYHHVEQKLLPAEHRKYDEEYWDDRKLAPSSLIYYVGLNKKLSKLQHHNLFFDADFNKHADQIYDNPAWPEKPLFYVSCPSKTDSTVAPEGHENLFILMPSAPGLIDTEGVQKRFFQHTIDRIEALTGESIREHIVYFRSYGPSNFIQDYNAFKGNAYGLANTLMQTANLKPSIVNKKVKNLFYTGQLTVPGPGVPPSLISGQVVAQHIINEHKKSRKREFA